MTGKTLSSFEFITYLLAGLGSDNESVVTSITTRADPLTTPQVYSHLLIHEARLTHQNHNLTISVELSANDISKTFIGNGSRGRGYPRDKGGSNRGGRGRGCGNGRQSHSSPTNCPTCQVCLKPGHTAWIP